MTRLLESSETSSDERTRRFAPEFRLALACVRWPLQEADRLEIDHLSKDPLNWKLFKRIVERNQILPLVYNNLREVLHDEDRVHDLEGLRELAVGRMGHCLSQAGELVRVTETARRAGIEMVALKGVSLSALAYGNFALRSPGDIDLLVCADRVSEAEPVLRGLGYTRMEPKAELTPKRLKHYLRYYKHFTYHSPSKSSVLELHWRLFHNMPLSNNAEAPAGATTSIAIGNGEVLTLSRNELFLYLCAHGSIHGWPILKWLADIGALLRLMTAGDMREVAALASERDLLSELRATLILVDLLLAIERPVVELPRAADPSVDRIVAMAQRLLTANNYCLEMTDLPRFGMFFYDLRLRSSWRYRREDLRRAIMLPEDWGWIDLPDAMFPLYAVVRPVSWLLRRLSRRAKRRSAGDSPSQVVSQ